MNVLVVDTSSWIAYFKVGNDEIDLALKEGRAYLSPVVAAELLSGKMPEKNREKLANFFRDLPLCDCDLDHWIQVGILRHKLAAKGLSISTPDAHVAQCALDLEGYLLSEDKVFEKIATKSSLKLSRP